MLHVNGRLYLSEQFGDEEIGGQEDDEDEWPQARREAGRRIFVLNPKGQTLQVWKAPRRPGPRLPRAAGVRGMVIFQDELIVDTLMGNEERPTLLSLAGI
uniref:Uncharacterized protein n=1 Tax=Haptolina ericina TaxID=156174 RepID=A0A7S3B5R6_9EUKA